MSKKHEAIEHPRMFYTFVDLGKPETDSAAVFVVPSAVVAFVVTESHRTWLSQPGKNGHVRKDSNMRRFLPDYSHIFGPDSDYAAEWTKKYCEAWHLLEEERLS